MTTQNSSHPTVRPVELSDLEATATSSVGSLVNIPLNTFGSVPARLSVVAGEVTATIGELMAMKQGQTMKLDTLLNAPFDLVLNNNVIARGELVAVGDHYGICITHLPVVEGK